MILVASSNVSILRKGGENKQYPKKMLRLYVVSVRRRSRFVRSNVTKPSEMNIKMDSKKSFIVNLSFSKLFVKTFIS